jgi:hypothetical protein
VKETTWFVTKPKQSYGSNKCEKADNPHGDLTRGTVEFESQSLEIKTTFGLSKKYDNGKSGRSRYWNSNNCNEVLTQHFASLDEIEEDIPNQEHKNTCANDSYRNTNRPPNWRCLVNFILLIFRRLFHSDHLADV